MRRVLSCLLVLLLSGAAAERVDVAADGKANAEKKTRFTDQLVVGAGTSLWKSVVEHKFTDELAAGTLDLNVLRCYLVQDHRFLDSFVVLLSSMVAAARNLQDRIPGAQFLALITGKENTYFERSFEALGVTPAMRETTPNATAQRDFNGLMRDTAKHGSLAEMLAVLCVAEWSYMTWGERVLPVAVAEPFYYREWVDLHSGEYFRSVVEYLRGLLDREADVIDAEEATRVQKRFTAAVRLEKQFFDTCYEGPAEVKFEM